MTGLEKKKFKRLSNQMKADRIRDYATKTRVYSEQIIEELDAMQDSIDFSNEPEIKRHTDIIINLSKQLKELKCEYPLFG